MKNKLVILAMVLLMLGSAAGYTKLFAADEEDAFSVLAQLEKNYTGLEKPGLDTLTANVVYSASHEITATAIVYYAKGKGLKIKVGDNTPIIVGEMIDDFVKSSGLGAEKFSVKYKLTKENVTGTYVTAIFFSKEETKMNYITFVPLKDKKLDFTKLVMAVDTTKEWMLKRFEITFANGIESVSDFEYKDGLIAKITSVTPGATKTITNTYTTVDKFVVPAKTEMGMDGKNLSKTSPYLMIERASITYSDVKVNVKIADEIFAAPKAGDVLKPTIPK